MKMLMKLAVFLATVFLLHGAALAVIDCDFEECYEFTMTLIDDPTFPIPTTYAKICLDYGDNRGIATRCVEEVEEVVPFSLFFDSMNRQALGYLEDCFIYTKFHGDNNAVATGFEYCESARLSFRGIITDWDKCNCPSSP